MVLLDGKNTAKTIIEEIATEVAKLKAAGRRVPHLVAVLVGEDAASHTYVNNKIKACAKAGFRSSLLKFDVDISEVELLATVYKLNNDGELDGFIVQSPLPAHIDERKITQAIDPSKDVDGFHPTNIGKMVLNIPTYLPATPYGILQLLERHQIQTAGKHCVVVGRSHIVGTPMSILMARNTQYGNCTVTLTHSKTRDLKAITQTADILIAALGKAEFVTADMVKQGATVIDVGINRVVDKSKKSGFSLKGDVKFSEVAPKCAFITRVPGGVGPMTVVSLMKNTLAAAKLNY